MGTTYTKKPIAPTTTEDSWGGGRLVCRPGDCSQSNTTVPKAVPKALGTTSQGVVLFVIKGRVMYAPGDANNGI